MPTIVDVTRGSRSENCRAAAASGTPRRAQASSRRSARATSSAGAAWAEPLARAEVRGVVQVDARQPVEPQPGQALLDRGAGRVAVEALRLRIAVGLGGQDDALGQPAVLAQGQADPPLALAES